MRRTVVCLLGILIACVAKRQAEDEFSLPVLRSGVSFALSDSLPDLSAILTFDRWGNLLEERAPNSNGVSETRVLRADGRAPAVSVLARAWTSASGSYYLAGRRPDGEMKLLPLAIIEGVGGQRQGFGGPLTPEDLCRAFGREGVVELRIVRRDGWVWYRWGHLRELGDTAPWDEGVARLTQREVESPGEGGLLGGLTDTLRRRAERRKGKRTLVLLELSDDARFVDMFRAVECARGRDDVIFEPPIGIIRPEIGVVRLPDPGEGDRELLQEAVPGRLVLSILPPRGGRPGGCWLNGRVISPEDIPFQSVPTLLRIDEETPWRLVLPVIAAARHSRSDVWFGISREEPGFRHERSFVVPPTPGSTVSEITLSGALSASASLAGQEIRLLVPKESSAGDVVRGTLHLLRRGACGVSFRTRD